MSTITKKQVVPVMDRAVRTMVELNKRIYNQEKFSLTSLVKENGGNSTWVKAINQRGIIEKVQGTGKYRWTSSNLSCDMPQLKLYAQWMIQDANEYSRKAWHKSKLKKAGKRNFVAQSVTKLNNLKPLTSEAKKDDEQPTTLLEKDWTPITRGTLLGLGSISSFPSFTFQHGSLAVFGVNKVEFLESEKVGSEKLTINLLTGNKLTASVVVESRKLYKFQRDESKFKFEIL